MNKDTFDCIVISDSNSVFIGWVLESVDFHDVFDNVFTNPAAFENSARLTVKNCHTRSCNSCLKNLCKNVVLLEFIDKQRRGEIFRIVYIGDCGNDVCSVTLLRNMMLPCHGKNILYIQFLQECLKILSLFNLLL